MMCVIIFVFISVSLFTARNLLAPVKKKKKFIEKKLFFVAFLMKFVSKKRDDCVIFDFIF